jgi:hypothetical protein
MIKHYLNFITSQHGRLEINEPEGFAKAGFKIKQRDGELGRDISYAGGKSSFRIYKNSQNEYHFDKVLQNWDLYSFNAIIKYEIQFDDTIFVIGELDMGATFKTNRVVYAEFNVVEESFVAMFKKFFGTNVNMFDTLSIFKTLINSVDTYRMFYEALPSLKVSEWITPTDNNISTSVAGVGGTGGNVIKYFNFANQSKRYEIKLSTSYIQGDGDKRDFIYINAQDNLTNIKVKISNVNFTLTGSGNGYGSTSLSYYVGDALNNADMPGTLLDNVNVNGSGTASIVNGVYEFTIPEIPRTKKLFIYWGSLARVDNNSSTFGIVNTLDSMDVRIEATATAYSTVMNVVRLVDAMRYSVEAVTGKNIVAPRWGALGEFYNQFIVTTSLMRNLLDRPFNISNKIIAEKYLPEVFGDYEVLQNGDVFYGIYRDFYRNVESGRFIQKATAYEESLNTEYYNNKLSYKYDNYQSQKENEADNSFDIVHGENERMYNNPSAQDAKEVSVGFIRDPKLTEENRIKVYTVSTNAATQDDNKIFIIDGLVSDSTISQTQTSLLQHTKQDNLYLILRNQGEIAWEVLGISLGSNFTITTGVNQGTYTVNAIDGNQITLYNGNGLALVENEETSTTYIYQIYGIDLIRRTDEGFTNIANINNGDKFGNLRFTVSRNIINYYSEFNATSVLFATDKEITNRLYNNNPDAETTYEGVYVREGDPITPGEPILHNKLITTTIDCSLKEWIEFQNSLRSTRGYMSIYDSEGLIERIYVSEGEWLAETADKDDMGNYYGSAKITGKQKYQPETISIFGEYGDITINDSITPSYYTYSVSDIGKLTIFDSTGLELFVPVMFNRVTVNGAVPQTKEELYIWMDQLTPEWDGL